MKFRPEISRDCSTTRLGPDPCWRFLHRKNTTDHAMIESLGLFMHHGAIVGRTTQNIELALVPGQTHAAAFPSLQQAYDRSR